MTTLPPTSLKTLDQTRHRLAQLTSALASLQSSILKSDPLPPPATLHSLTSILSSTLTAYTTHLTSSSPTLNTMAAFPLPTYPGRAIEAEGLLQRLLRKKLEVGAEGWVEEGRVRGRVVVEGMGAEDGGDSFGGREGEGYGGVGAGFLGGEMEGEAGLWMWAGREANRVARGYRWGGMGEEEEEEGEEGEEDDEDMEGKGDGAVENGEGEEKEGGSTGGGEMLPVADVLRFLSTGREPVRKVEG